MLHFTAHSHCNPYTEGGSKTSGNSSPIDCLKVELVVGESIEYLLVYDIPNYSSQVSSGIFIVR